MIHTSLVDYYKVNDLMVCQHNYSVRDIESMYTYERDLYVELIIERMKSTEI